MTALLGCLSVSPPVATQATGVAGESAELDAPFVDNTHAMQAFRRVEAWSREGKVGPRTDGPIRVSRVLGVQVTLRTHGHVLGTGVAWRPDLLEVLEAGQTPASLDLVPLLEPAAFQAFENARQRLRDAARNALEMKRLNPDLRGAGEVPTLKELHHDTALDLQIMHAPDAVVIADNEPGGAATQRFAPGYHGLIAVLKDGDGTKSAAIWPGTALAQNLGPARQLRVLVAQLDLPFTATRDLGRPDGPRLYRAEALHVVRPSVDLPPVALERGNQPDRNQAFGEERLDALADTLAGHLLRRFIGRGGVRGTYLPSPDAFDPELASLPDAALAALALAQHHRTDGLLARPDVQGPGIVHRVDELLELAAEDLDADTDPLVIDPDTAALLTLARLERNADTADPVSRRLLAEVTAEVDEHGRVLTRVTDEQPTPRELSRPAAAIVTLALGRHALADQDEATRDLAAAALQRLWERQPLRDGNALPWVALLVDEVEPALVTAGLLDAEAYSIHRQQLDHTVDQLEAFQIIERPALGPDDVRGGFVIPAPSPGTPPTPTWNTAPLLAAMVTTLRLDQKRDGDGLRRDHFGRLITAQYAARFLDRLVIRPAAAYYAKQPRMVVGAARPALHDNRLSITPSAMTLFAVDQFRQTLHAQHPAQRAVDAEPVAP